MSIESSRSRRYSIMAGAAALGLMAGHVLFSDEELGRDDLTVEGPKKKLQEPKTITTQQLSPEVDEPKNDEEEVLGGYSPLLTQRYFNHALLTTFIELNECRGSSLNCHTPNQWNLLGDFLGIHTGNWDIVCEASYPYPQQVVVAIDPYNGALSFGQSKSDMPFLPDALTGYPTGDLYYPCESAMRYLDQQNWYLSRAQDEVDVFLYEEREFDYDEEEGCYILDLPEEMMAMDVCDTDHPLEPSIWIAELDEDGEFVDWIVEGEILEVDRPWDLKSAIEARVNEEIGTYIPSERVDTGIFDTGYWE